MSEAVLKELGISYGYLEDGSLFVPGSINLGKRSLFALPDLSSVVVGGSFYCQGNELVSLAGAPKLVGGDFFCNQNKLTSLAGAPREVGLSFYCDENDLASLVGAPETVGFTFACEDNRLTSLYGISPSIGHAIFCKNNPLEALEGGEKPAVKILSDFGEFKKWEDVPDALRETEQTRARKATEMRERIIREGTTLQRPVKLLKRIKGNP